MVWLKTRSSVLVAVATFFVFLFLLDNDANDLRPMFQWTSLERIRLKPSAKSRTTINASYATFRGYHHEPLYCSVVNTLATTTSSEPLTCTGQVVTFQTCGGVPFYNGSCISASKSKFIYDEDVFCSFRNSQPANRRCGEFVTDGDVLHLGSFDHDYFVGPHHICHVNDLNPRWFTKTFNQKLIVIIGDSHARNIYTAAIAELRNQKYIAERHPDQNTKEQLYPFQRYQIFETYDLLDIELTQALDLSYAEARGRTCSEETIQNCATILFLWSGFLHEYELYINLVLPKIAPDIIITDWLTPAYVKNPLTEYQALLNMWGKYFTKAGGKFIVSPFPLNNGELVTKNLSAIWHQNQGSFFPNKNLQVRSFLIDQTKLLEDIERTGRTMAQLRNTAHSVCALREVYSLAKGTPVVPGNRIVAYEKCSAPTDRAVARLALTYSASE